MSYIQHPGPTLSLWQGQQLAVVSSPLLLRTPAHRESLLASGGVRVPLLTHWIPPCLAAAPSTAHKGESSPPVASSLLCRTITFENPLDCFVFLRGALVILNNKKKVLSTETKNVELFHHSLIFWDAPVYVSLIANNPWSTVSALRPNPLLIWASTPSL